MAAGRGLSRRSSHHVKVKELTNPLVGRYCHLTRVFNWAITGFFAFFSSFNAFDSKLNLPMTGIKLQISGVGSDRSAQPMRNPHRQCQLDNVILISCHILSQYTTKDTKLQKNTVICIITQISFVFAMNPYLDSTHFFVYCINAKSNFISTHFFNFQREVATIRTSPFQ